ALDRWRGGDRRTFVTLDGELVDDQGIVTGGSREAAGAGILAQKREIRELDGIIGELEAQHNDATFRHQQLKNELATLQTALDTRKLYEALEAAQEAVTRVKVEVGQAQEKKASLEKQLFRLTADGDEKRARRVRLEEGIRTGETRAGELRAQVAATREELLRK